MHADRQGKPFVVHPTLIAWEKRAVLGLTPAGSVPVQAMQLLPWLGGSEVVEDWAHLSCLQLELQSELA